MSFKIRGNTVGTPTPRTNYEQTDPKKADYLRGRDILKQEISAAKAAGDNANTAAGKAQTAADNAQTAANKAQTTANNAQTAANTAKNSSVQKTGDTMTGPLTVPEPTAQGHAANKGYVDSLRSATVISSLQAHNWSGASAPYTQTISVAGVAKSSFCTPHVGLILADDSDTALKQIESFSYISKGETGDGTITFTCLEYKPEVNIDIQIEVHGAGGSGSTGGTTGGSGSSGGGNTGDVSIVGIVSVTQTTTSTEDGGINVITVLMSDGTKSTFRVRNGSKGRDGQRGSGIIATDVAPLVLAGTISGMQYIAKTTTSQLKSDSPSGDVFVGDFVLNGSNLFHVCYVSSDFIYMDTVNEIKGSSNLLFVSRDEQGKPSHSAEEIIAAAEEGKQPVLCLGHAMFTEWRYNTHDADTYVRFAGVFNEFNGSTENIFDNYRVICTIRTRDQDAEIFMEPVEDGAGIKDISQTTVSSEDGGVNVLTITLGDGTKHTFQVRNGSRGSQGEKGEDGTSVTVEMIRQGTGDGMPSGLQFSDGTYLEVYNGSKGDMGERGTGILKVTTAPTSYTTETAGVNPVKRMSLSTIKSQAGVDEVLIGDLISYSYYLYHVYYKDATYAYMDTSQSIRGASGAKGSTGATGPQGPAGTTPVKGEDYFTEAEKQEIVTDVLALIPGSGGSEIVTTLGNTPQTLTKSGVVRLTCASECAYSVTSDTVAVFDIMKGTKTKVILTDMDGYYQLKGDGTATAFYDQYLTMAVTGLTVGEKYNFVFDAAGMPWNDSAHITVGHWIFKDGDGITILTKESLANNVKQVYEFTATTTTASIVWYPTANNYFDSTAEMVANVNAIYINKAGTSNLTGVVALSGTFTGTATLGTVPVGATISAEPTATVYLITSNETDETVAKPLNGKTVVCFGDSLFGMYRGDNSAPAFVAEYTGATVHNVGFGGCRMSVHPTSGYAAFSMWALAKAIAENDWTTQDAQASSGSSYFAEQLALLKSIDFNEVDMVVIHYGTNDFAAGGGTTIDNTSDPDDYSTLCGALRYSVEKLLGAYPKLQIYVSLPVYRFWTESGTTTYAEDYVRYNHTLPDFVAALKATAAEYNLPVIDGYHGMGVNRFNAAAYLDDGTHHNVDGRKLFGEFIGGHLMSRQASGTSGVDTAAVNALISAAIGDAIGGSY